MQVNSRISPSVNQSRDFFCDHPPMVENGEIEAIAATGGHVDGGAVRKIRELRGLNGRELAEIVGLSASYISQLEAGKKGASHRTLFLLSRALACTIEQISTTPGDYPQALADFLETVAPEDIGDDEIEVLRLLRLPGRRLTVRAYNNLLDAIRNSEKIQ